MAKIMWEVCGCLTFGNMTQEMYITTVVSFNAGKWRKEPNTLNKKQKYFVNNSRFLGTVYLTLGAAGGEFFSSS